MRSSRLLASCLTLLLAAGAGRALAQGKEEISIPAGIKYKYTSPAKIQKAKELITRDLADSTSYELSGKSLIIGPLLWHRYKQVQPLRAIEKGEVTLHVNDQQLEGKLTQTEADTRKVWQHLRREIHGQPFTIRKLTEPELQYYWAVISFDIDEPLLIVETAEHKYLLNIVPTTMKLLWLDETPRPR